MSMRWENLADNCCPYCDARIELRDTEYHCTVCLFHIEPERMISIVEHRKPDRGGTVIFFKWQNLLKDRCPICNDLLGEPTGVLKVLRCINSLCPFGIQLKRLREMLANPNHPANRYKDFS